MPFGPCEDHNNNQQARNRNAGGDTDSGTGRQSGLRLQNSLCDTGTAAEWEAGRVIHGVAAATTDAVTLRIACRTLRCLAVGVAAMPAFAKAKRTLGATAAYAAIAAASDALAVGKYVSDIAAAATSAGVTRCAAG